MDLGWSICLCAPTVKQNLGLCQPSGTEVEAHENKGLEGEISDADEACPKAGGRSFASVQTRAF
jgi:hypothetical protein